MLRVIPLCVCCLLMLCCGAFAQELASYDLRKPSDEKLLDMKDSSFHTHFTAVAGEEMLQYAMGKVTIDTVIAHCRQAFTEKNVDYNNTLYLTFRDINEEELHALLPHNLVYFYPVFVAVHQGKGGLLVEQGIISDKSVAVVAAALPILQKFIKDGELEGSAAEDLKEQPKSRPAPRGATGQ